MFLSTIDHEARSFSARTKPIDGLWMTDHKLKSVMLCEPQYKNDYGKVFGGVIMEKCVDLAFSNTWVYTGLGKNSIWNPDYSWIITYNAGQSCLH